MFSERGNKVVKNFLKILAVIFVVSLVARFCRANFSVMTEHEMYISTADDNIRIELTEEKTDSNSPRPIVYLYVDDEVYEGTYEMFVSNKLKKELWLTVDDYGMCHEALEVNPGSPLTENFYVKRNKLVVQDPKWYLTRKSIFKDNNTFIRKTWWNTWGKTAAIIVGVLFVIWLFKDVPKMLKDKGMRQMFKELVNESVKEYVDDVAEDFKDIFQ